MNQSGFSNSKDEIRALRQEIDRLKGILKHHGISWHPHVHSSSTCSATIPDQAAPAASADQLAAVPKTSVDKINLFRTLFRGRADVFPLRWESTKGRSGYSPACANEWRAGVCLKPSVRCSQCPHRELRAVSDQVIYDHLAGKHTIGVYPLLPDDTCHFLATDFDEKSWQDDARAMVQSCEHFGVPAALEISRSGRGAHVWIFFSEPVSAREARLLGAALISHTCAQTRQLSLASYDRFFPNQDTLPKGGFGNLIALPLQKRPRNDGHSVFVDSQFTPHSDQWAYLASIQRMTKSDLETALLTATRERHPLDVAFTLDDATPWQRRKPASPAVPGPHPESVQIVLAHQVFVPKDPLSQPLLNRVIRLAAFQNPEFFKAQAMRLPVWNKPRIIGCAENHPNHIGLPRGCMDALIALFKKCRIRPEIQDKRECGRLLKLTFKGHLRPVQERAVQAMMKHDIGILCAPTAFGKTVAASAIIARRHVNTLVLVHRTQLMHQWQQRVSTFLDVAMADIGLLGGGKKQVNGKLDVALLQSVSRLEDIDAFLSGYGQIVIDECHHISAYSFETILKTARAKYLLGLTATPERRDGHHPIIFMQCGPIRHTAEPSLQHTVNLDVMVHVLGDHNTSSDGLDIQELFRMVAQDTQRNQKITDLTCEAYTLGRKILVLTERVQHLLSLQEMLTPHIPDLVVLHGRLGKKCRVESLERLEQMDPLAPRVVLATGRLIGEGFDHAPLDTLVLAMPISWKGTLQQYVGRLHRTQATKSSIRVIDFVDQQHIQLTRMWRKRQKGFRAMGYEINWVDGEIPRLQAVTTHGAQEKLPGH